MKTSIFTNYLLHAQTLQLSHRALAATLELWLGSRSPAVGAEQPLEVVGGSDADDCHR